jgi:hypothetical protein
MHDQPAARRFGRREMGFNMGIAAVSRAAGRRWRTQFELAHRAAFLAIDQLWS